MTIKVFHSWLHGLNPVERHPESVVIRIINGNKEVAVQEVGGVEDWSGSFQVPKYDVNGNEIQYTIKVDGIEEYTHQVDSHHITGIHHSVVLDGDGIPNGRFWEEDSLLHNIWNSIVLSGINGFWILQREARD